MGLLRPGFAVGRMGAELLRREPVFAASVAQAEPLIARESGFSVTEAMSAPETVTGIDRVQPTLFAMQVALATAMQSYGVRPGAVIGHSLGEVAAAVVAEALSLEDGVRVICRRSRLLAGSPAPARWPRWNCPPSRYARNWLLAVSPMSWCPWSPPRSPLSSAARPIRFGTSSRRGKP